MSNIKIRKIIQFVSLAIFILLVLMLNQNKLCVAHEFCPYSPICFGIFNFLSGAKFFVFPITIVVSILFLFSVLFIGRKFCGYICPFGTIQEYFHGLGKEKQRFKQYISYNLHRRLKIIKYVILIITILFILIGKQSLYMKYCPVLFVSHIGTVRLFSGLVLIIVFLSSFFIDRIWCRYLCPYAALMNLVQWIGQKLNIRRLKIKRNIKTSLECCNCINYCPMQIDIGTKEEILDFECIHCHGCVRKCLKTNKSKKDCLYCNT